MQISILPSLIFAPPLKRIWPSVQFAETGKCNKQLLQPVVSVQVKLVHTHWKITLAPYTNIIIVATVV